MNNSRPQRTDLANLHLESYPAYYEIVSGEVEIKLDQNGLDCIGAASGSGKLPPGDLTVDVNGHYEGKVSRSVPITFTLTCIVDGQVQEQTQELDQNFNFVMAGELESGVMNKELPPTTIIGGVVYRGSWHFDPRY